MCPASSVRGAAPLASARASLQTPESALGEENLIPWSSPGPQSVNRTLEGHFREGQQHLRGPGSPSRGSASAATWMA